MIKGFIVVIVASLEGVVFSNLHLLAAVGFKLDLGSHVFGL
jgi:hypothetical protein